LWSGGTTNAAHLLLVRGVFKHSMDVAECIARRLLLVINKIWFRGPIFSGLHVLIVDDYPDNVNSMALLLRMYGHEVDTALSGRAALLQARVNEPDVVLLDISMPEMNGYAVASHLREMYHEDIILIAVTANGSEEDQRRCLEASFNRHLIKPTDPEKLKDLLQKLANTLEQTYTCNDRTFASSFVSAAKSSGLTMW
jgi:CheY-like chemotaxis protein